MFENTTSSKQQGNIGIARAIYEYTKRGYSVLLPLTDSNKYDLVLEKDGIFSRVQVKTTSLKEPSSKPGVYRAILEARGGGGNHPKVVKRQNGDYDILFILTVDDECWSIPEVAITAHASLAVGTEKYSQFKF